MSPTNILRVVCLTIDGWQYPIRHSCISSFWYPSLKMRTRLPLDPPRSKRQKFDWELVRVFDSCMLEAHGSYLQGRPTKISSSCTRISFKCRGRQCGMQDTAQSRASLCDKIYGVMSNGNNGHAGTHYEFAQFNGSRLSNRSVSPQHRHKHALVVSESQDSNFDNKLGKFAWKTIPRYH